MFIPGFRYSMIFVSMMEKKGFEVLFQDGKARLRPRGSSSMVLCLELESMVYMLIFSTAVKFHFEQLI